MPKEDWDTLVKGLLNSKQREGFKVPSNKK